MSLFADDVDIIPLAEPKRKTRERKPKKPRENTKKIEELREKVKKKMESMVKTREYLQLYSTLRDHIEALQTLYGNAPTIDKQMNLETLKQIYTDIHEGKYGKL